MVYDIGSAASFSSLPEWLAEMERFAGKNVHRILIGNKSDLTDREVEVEKGEQFAKENGMPFLETSAKYSDNIDELFSQLAKMLRDTHADRNLKTPHGIAGTRSHPTTVSLSAKKQKHSGRCC